MILDPSIEIQIVFMAPIPQERIPNQVDYRMHAVASELVFRFWIFSSAFVAPNGPFHTFSLIYTSGGVKRFERERKFLISAILNFY